uniref:Uncharacterized protein n=1 Tax=Ailuropoda melanoleuca TaxID=9646 RepID=A0A7N5K5M2_AILME
IVPSQDGMILKPHFHKNWQLRVICRQKAWQAKATSTRRWHGPLGSQWIQEGRTSSQSPCRPVCHGRRSTTPSSPLPQEALSPQERKQLC